MKHHKFGFTLAEVLITLGIIGVVAAMTLPMLISHHNKTEVETRLQRVNSILNSVVKLAENDYGEPKYWADADSPTVLQTYFMPYLSGSSFVNESTMGKYKVYTFDDKSSFTLNGGHASGIKLKTGEIIGVKYGIVENRETLEFYVLIKNNKKNKYVVGREYFTFYMDLSKGIVGTKPWSDHGGLSSCINDRVELISRCNSSNYGGIACLMLIECNGWKIPKDYPIRL